MKFLKFLVFLILLALIGGFGYFAFTDVPIEQEITVKEIPNERLNAE